MRSLTRTSRSLLHDRLVRVDRRLRVNDGAYGTYQEFQTIIARYWVQLYPAQHPRRERVELGEQQAPPVDYRASSDPSHNGKTVMIGDRFVDEKNNECYDVVAVDRPPPRLGYSARIHYTLRIVKDGCPKAIAGYPSVVIPAAPVVVPEQTHFIMRHFGGDEIQTWDSLPYYDGFVYNLIFEQEVNLEALNAAVASGKRWWRYYNIQTYPFSGTIFGGTVGNPPLTSWFNYLRDNIQFAGSASHRRMRVGDLVALFPDPTPPANGEQQELIPWVSLSSAERTAVIGQMVTLARAPVGVPVANLAGVFTDQSWLSIFSFQVDETAESGHGDTKESQPGLQALSFASAETNFGDGGSWASTTAAVMAFFQELATALAAEGQYVIANGEHRTTNGSLIPKPWYFENAWNSGVDGPGGQPERWANAKAAFATDRRNVLSILVSDTPNDQVGVPEALEYWEQVGGWIAFTQNQDSAEAIANQELAYAQAAARLEAMGFPNG